MSTRGRLVRDPATGPPAEHAASGPVVGDVMLQCPKTLPEDATLAQARAALDDEHVHLVLLTRGDTLVGTVSRSDLPTSTAGPVLPWSTLTGRTVPPDVPAQAVQDLLNEQGARRLAVVDADGTLLGLACLKRRRTGFCSAADVASRARSPR